MVVSLEYFYPVRRYFIYVSLHSRLRKGSGILDNRKGEHNAYSVDAGVWCQIRMSFDTLPSKRFTLSVSIPFT